MFVQILPPRGLVSTLITGISHFLMETLDVSLQIIPPDTLVITLITFIFLKAVVMLFFLMFFEMHFQLCFVLTLITIYVVDVVVDLIVTLKKTFLTSGEVTGGTLQNWFFYLTFYFMNFIYVFVIASFTQKNFVT